MTELFAANPLRALLRGRPAAIAEPLGADELIAGTRALYRLCTELQEVLMPLRVPSGTRGYATAPETQHASQNSTGASQSSRAMGSVSRLRSSCRRSSRPCRQTATRRRRHPPAGQ